MLNPVLKILLTGVYDPGSPLSNLRGCPHIVRAIWNEVKAYWESLIQFPNDQEDSDVDYRCIVDLYDGYSVVSKTFFTPIYGLDDLDAIQISFPEPSGININMMPFIVGETFESCKLPDYVEPYWKMIQCCLKPEIYKGKWHAWPRKFHPSDIGKVYYLTIQESFVEPGTSQRRPGLHVDSPGKVELKNATAEDNVERGKGTAQGYGGHYWGMGCAHIIDSNFEWNDEQCLVVKDGIYLASSVKASCRVWNCQVAPEAIEK